MSDFSQANLGLFHRSDNEADGELDLLVMVTARRPAIVSSMSDLVPASDARAVIPAFLALTSGFDHLVSRYPLGPTPTPFRHRCGLSQTSSSFGECDPRISIFRKPQSPFSRSSWLKYPMGPPGLRRRRSLGAAIHRGAPAYHLLELRD